MFVEHLGISIGVAVLVVLLFVTSYYRRYILMSAILLVMGSFSYRALDMFKGGPSPYIHNSVSTKKILLLSYYVTPHVLYVWIYNIDQQQVLSYAVKPDPQIQEQLRRMFAARSPGQQGIFIEGLELIQPLQDAAPRRNELPSLKAIHPWKPLDLREKFPKGATKNENTN